MGPEFQKAADTLAACLRAAADCIDNGGQYEEALGKDIRVCALCWVRRCADSPTRACMTARALRRPPVVSLRALEARWHALGALCPDSLASSWGENEVLTSDMLVGTLFGLGTR